MVDVLVADKYDHIRKGTDLLLAQLAVFRQLHVLAAPIVKYQQGIAACDGESAVVIVHNGESGIQKNCHLHGRNGRLPSSGGTPVIMKNTGIYIMKPPGRKAAETNV